MKRQLNILLAGLAVIALILSACGGAAPTAAPTTAPTQPPPTAKPTEPPTPNAERLDARGLDTGSHINACGLLDCKVGQRPACTAWPSTAISQ